MVWDRQPPLDPNLARALGVGGSKRIGIPVTEQLRIYDRIADNLRALANEMDLASRGLAGHPAPTPQHAIPAIACAIDACNSKINILCHQYGIRLQNGRPADRERSKIKEQADNRPETEDQKEPAPRLQLVSRED